MPFQYLSVQPQVKRGAETKGKRIIAFSYTLPNYKFIICTNKAILYFKKACG